MDLSVSLVVAEAGLSRSSFYSQFNDIGDVAVQLIAEHYEQLATQRSHDPNVGRLADSTSYLLAEFDKRRYLYSAVLGSSADVDAEWAACEIIANALLPIIEPLAPATTDPKFAARYIAAAQIAIMIDWLRSEEPAPLIDVKEQLIAMLPSWV